MIPTWWQSFHLLRLPPACLAAATVRVRLLLESREDDHGKAIRALRWLLKRLLRGNGWKCVEAEELPEQAEGAE